MLTHLGVLCSQSRGIYTVGKLPKISQSTLGELGVTEMAKNIVV